MSTLIFPQLTTGGVAQFPVRKSVVQRTTMNRAVSEHLTKMADPEGSLTAWDLPYSGLTDIEMAAFEELFVACEGRLRPFVFLDPLGNLLQWTEDMSESVWQTGMLVAAGIEDPVGGTGACRLTNGAQAPQEIVQGVDGPGWFTYTFSVSVRSESTDAIRLVLRNADGVVSAERPVSGDWERVSMSGAIEGSAHEIRCAIEVPGGSAVEVFGPQLEAQRDASGYRKNIDGHGLHLARFDQDEFERVSYGPDNHATRIRVVTVRGVTV